MCSFSFLVVEGIHYDVERSSKMLWLSREAPAFCHTLMTLLHKNCSIKLLWLLLHEIHEDGVTAIHMVKSQLLHHDDVIVPSYTYPHRSVPMWMVYSTVCWRSQNCVRRHELWYVHVDPSLPPRPPRHAQPLLPTSVGVLQGRKPEWVRLSLIPMLPNEPGNEARYA